MKASSDVAAPRTVTEARLPLGVPAYGHPEWVERFPWLIQGTTARGEPDEPFDLRLFGDQPVGDVLARWRRLREAVVCPRAVHALQVHGTRVLTHSVGCAGLLVADHADAHVTRTAGTLLTVSIADCVPVFVVAPEHHVIAVLHAGWRGVASGMIEAGLAAVRSVAGSEACAVWLHLGPSICGACYEVGPEVHEALGLPRQTRNTPVDLRSVAAVRAESVGVAAENVTVSSFCTRCGGAPFFSHRAGSAARQVGFIGIRE